MKQNEHIAKLSSGYLFPEIAKRRRAFASAHPDARIISLGIGNTTEPLTPHICTAMAQYAQALGTKSGYSGYGDDSAGVMELRDKIAQVLYNGAVSAGEVYISDGAKCDVGRIQQLFGSGVTAVVQDPAYPVYVDGSVMTGAAGGARADGSGYEGVVYMPCTAENQFFPSDLSVIPENALIYFCSPNNPTGAVASKAQLAALVAAARAKKSVIIFDAAYAAYIRDPSLPRSIFEIDGARECAIEINSFSKPIGFTGVRLGWTVVPKELTYEDGSSVARSWERLTNTIFNGASNIAQQGGLASLSAEGQKETRALTDYYLANARRIREALSQSNFSAAGVEVYGGDNAPYVWVRFPGRKSWDIFDRLLCECHVVCTPGAGFGPAGESYIRFSAFGHQEDVAEACGRLARFSV